MCVCGEDPLGILQLAKVLLTHSTVLMPFVCSTPGLEIAIKTNANFCLWLINYQPLSQVVDLCSLKSFFILRASFASKK